MYCLYAQAIFYRVMRPFLLLILTLLALDRFARADQVPRIEITPSYSMSELDVRVIQHGPLVSISGHVRRSDPWAESTWGYLEISLFDRNSELIRRFAAEYFPRPMPHEYRSAYQPESRFSLTIYAVTRPVYVVKIVNRDGPVPHYTPKA